MSDGLASGVTLTTGQAAFIRVLRQRLPKDIGLYVTSAGRGPARQAAAMLAKYERAGGGEAGAKALYDLYAADDVIRELVTGPVTEEAWTAVIARAGSKISRHLSEGALDLRSRDWSNVQRDAVIAAVKAEGGRTIYEGDHLHVDIPAAYAKQTGNAGVAKVGGSKATVGGKKTFPYGPSILSRRNVVLAAGAVTLSVLLLQLRRRRLALSATP